MTQQNATYTCAACKGVFNTGWTEEEAEAEYRALFPGEAASGAPRDVVCDDCFKAMGEEFGWAGEPGAIPGGDREARSSRVEDTCP